MFEHFDIECEILEINAPQRHPYRSLIPKTTASGPRFLQTKAGATPHPPTGAPRLSLPYHWIGWAGNQSAHTHTHTQGP